MLSDAQQSKAAEEADASLPRNPLAAVPAEGVVQLEALMQHADLVAEHGDRVPALSGISLDSVAACAVRHLLLAATGALGCIAYTQGPAWFLSLFFFFLSVSPCLSLSRPASLCLTLSRPVSLCLTLSHSVSLCITLSRSVSLCLALSRSVSLSLSFSLLLSFFPSPRHFFLSLLTSHALTCVLQESANVLGPFLSLSEIKGGGYVDFAISVLDDVAALKAVAAAVPGPAEVRDERQGGQTVGQQTRAGGKTVQRSGNNRSEQRG